MHRPSRTAYVGFAVALCLTALANTASAQNAGFVRLIRPYHQVALAQLPEVEKELSLTDEQKQLAQDLNDDLNQERMALWQEAAGDFDSIREDMALLNNDIADEFAAKLDDAQKKPKPMAPQPSSTSELPRRSRSPKSNRGSSTSCGRLPAEVGRALTGRISVKRKPTLKSTS
jgi:hypothetical protein